MKTARISTVLVLMQMLFALSGCKSTFTTKDPTGTNGTSSEGSASNDPRTPGASPTPTPTPLPASSPTPSPVSVSPQGATVPPSAQLIDSAKAVWTLTNGAQVAKNGVTDTSTKNANLLLYYNSTIYHRNTSNLWFSWTGSTWASAKDLRSTAATPTPVPPSTPTPPPVSSATPAPTPVPSSGPQLYVSPSGNDSNNGSQSAPFRTIQRAVNAAYPGVTVRVMAGTYAEKIYARVSGTASARIRIISDTKWAARIRPSGASGEIFRNGGSYVDIEGFEIDGTNSPDAREGIYLHGSHVSAKGNYVHHIHYSYGCTSQGAGGIIGEGYYGDVDVNVNGNLIHDVGPGGCTFDHGIYHTGEGQIMNNVVYRASGAAIHMWHDPRKLFVLNNTVSDSGTGIVLGGGDFYNTTNTPGDYIMVANNIIYRNQVAVWAGGTLGPNNTYVNNLLFGNKTDWSLGSGSPTGTINADPMFVNYQSGGGGDYRLRAGSPAVNRGTGNSAPNVDFDGFARPSGGAFDIGAFEAH